MDLMIRDVTRVEGQGHVLTGPWLSADVGSQDDVAWLLGTQVTVSAKHGQPLHLLVKAVSLRQTMSGAMEARLGVEHPPRGVAILVDSIVTVGR